MASSSRSQIFSHKLLAGLFFLLVVSGLVLAPSGTYEAVPAGCEQCLCMDAPTCVPVMGEGKGYPYRSYEKIIDYEYLQEPYKSEINGVIRWRGVVANSLAGLAASALVVFIFRKKMS